MINMKKYTGLFLLLIVFNSLSIAQVPKEQLLWSGKINNPIQYFDERVTTHEVSDYSLSGYNRVFSCVSEPVYTIFSPENEKSNGIGLVILPGGGFREVDFDREGNDIGLFFAKQGFTSLVLKYRTFNPHSMKYVLKWSEYSPHVYADAKKAIFQLRNNADKFAIDTGKIGIIGFSAGGGLALFTALEMYENQLPAYTYFKNANTTPDFTCLLYPSIMDNVVSQVKSLENIPPMFIINSSSDSKTPVNYSIELYQALLEKKVPTEMHIYANGTHGFDLGKGKGYSLSLWTDSFIAWLKDMKILEIDEQKSCTIEVIN